MSAGIDLHAIARQFGGEVYDGGRRWLGPGPGHNRKDRSLSVVLGHGGRAVVHSFSSRTTWQEGAQHLGISDASTERLSNREDERMRLERERAAAKRHAERMAFCASVWSGTQPAEGSPVADYLRSRSIFGQIPGVLRFHPAAPFGYPAAMSGKDHEPVPTACMVALVQDAKGEPSGLHLTALPSNWKPGVTVRRIMLGAIAGASCRLFEIGDDAELAAGEGVESCLSFASLNGVPCWATLSTANLKTFSSPSGLRRLVIAADGDEAGLTAARELAERASGRCEVVIAAAADGLDWNDELQGVANERP
jgi:hypothetical protein